MAADADREGQRVVVCALDGSSADASTVEVATQLAALAGARLALVAVAPVPTGDPREFALPAWTLEVAMRALELTAATLDGRVGVDCYLDAGNPVRRLVEFAARTRVLLIVVGNACAGVGSAALDRRQRAHSRGAVPGRGCSRGSAPARARQGEASRLRNRRPRSGHSSQRRATRLSPFAAGDICARGHDEHRAACDPDHIRRDAA